MLEELLKRANKEQLVALYDKISDRIREIDIENSKNETILLEIGKIYIARNKDKIQITQRYLSVYRGINLTNKHTKDINIKFPEYYINGRTSKEKETPMDIVEE